MAKGFNPIPGKVVKLEAGLRRILAPNPSPMTYRGTNTYLLGSRDIAVIDPGPPDEAHMQAILDALEGHQRISHIFVTHSHIDHSPLAMVLAQLTGTRVYAFGDSKSGRDPALVGMALGGGEGIDESFAPDAYLANGEVIEGTTWTITALHTPGHMGNHMCFAWKEGHALFTGDLVMDWASSMVSPPDGDLAAFMASLDVLSARGDDRRYYPGHGAPVETPQARVTELRDHRHAREAQIIDTLAAGPQTPDALTRAIYTDVEDALLPAAARNVLAHLIALHKSGVVSCDGPLGPDAKFTRV